MTEDVEYIIRKIIEEYKQCGLIVNIEKTIYLCIDNEHENLNLEDNSIIAVCSNYKYYLLNF